MLEVTDDMSKALSGRSVVYFTAAWCQPCKQLKPLYARAGTLDQDNNYFVVDVDNIDSEYLKKYNIMSVPQIFVMSDGEILHKIEGRTTEAIMEEVNARV